MGAPLRSLPPGFDALSVEEQVEYLNFLWSRIAARPEQIPVPDWHQEIIDERMRDLAADPGAGRAWKEIETDLRTITKTGE